MIRQLPIIPTILVVAAAAIMVWLGIWQLGRADEKAAMIAEFEESAASERVTEIEYSSDQYVYRKVRMDCPEPRDWQAVAGRHENGASGYVHRYECGLTEFFAYDAPSRTPVLTYADIGWSNSPAQPDFSGGMVEGVLVRLGDNYKIVVSEPLAGLDPIAKPDPNDLPNNHLAYAGQWFFFALTALVIYWFAVRSRMAKRD